ncbi:transcription/translation regulatory transformer protein RfaH [Vibrio sp. HA2012]|uniref:transcription/translation regulatory transformer protein RfaH n=1 Tax=Vibrio sp. HA2012 TaxID=1971595 RepID=UPI000C2CACD9|nr:transcription/translation regulatory transformer protein RfaH [Vibrio sp. HA2012]PJC85486.1 transcription/translation regulatory transformer protein RfaH [Vibrio sp. HA2012]
MKRWYLLYCKRGDQNRAKSHLENQGVECYYPEIEVEKIVRGKRQRIHEPLFPSYVFVRFDYEEGPSFTTIRSTRGVVDFIRQGRYPQEVRGELVHELRLHEESGEVMLTGFLPEKGQPVHIKEGQFSGVEALYHEADGEKRSILLIKLINQTVPVSIDNRDIELK